MKFIRTRVPLYQISETRLLGQPPSAISSEDRTRFIVSLKELIESNILPTNKALDLISKVEQGYIPLPQAFLLIERVLQQ